MYYQLITSMSQNTHETKLKYKFEFNQFSYFVNYSIDRKKADGELVDLSSKDEQNNKDKRLKRLNTKSYKKV